MKDAYTTAFYDVVKETQSTSGYELPQHLEAYIVMLLSDFVERTDFLPEKSFAEAFLSVQRVGQAKELGDVCLFVSGVFPTYKKRFGLSRKYFQDIGASSYERCSIMNEDLFIQLATHFNFLSEFIEISCSRKDLRNLLF